MKLADREDGIDRDSVSPGTRRSAELREARKRIRLLEQEAGGDAPGGGPFVAEHQPTMMYRWSLTLLVTVLPSHDLPGAQILHLSILQVA